MWNFHIIINANKGRKARKEENKINIFIIIFHMMWREKCTEVKSYSKKIWKLARFFSHLVLFYLCIYLIYAIFLLLLMLNSLLLVLLYTIISLETFAFNLMANIYMIGELIFSLKLSKLIHLHVNNLRPKSLIFSLISYNYYCLKFVVINFLFLLCL